RKVKKLAGVDFAKSLASRAAERGWGVFLLGAKKAVVEAAATQLMKDNPGIRISGVQDGYFQNEEEAAEKVRSARPDILLVALGVPRQEKWISEYQEKLEIPVCMGVGGTFDVLAGTVKRAPGLMRSLQLEWLFRLYQEPWRWRRMIQSLPLFVWLVWRGRKEGAS
ncbi:MAG TPA: WecB/TagA/CpsF family glycosyltransferase, partial [Chroococcales cyanobacterium]